MLFWTTVKVGLRSLLANKLRSLLTMLGVVIGVGAVLSMLAIGEGAEQQVMARIKAMGTNLVTVTPNWQRKVSVRGNTAINLKVADAQAILREVEGIKEMAPVVWTRQQGQCLNRNQRVAVAGTSSTYRSIAGFSLQSGRYFKDSEVDNRMRVCAMGSLAAQKLFGENDPVGQTIRIKGIRFRVVGLLEPKGDLGAGGDADDRIYMPYTVAMQELMGVDWVNMIQIHAEEGQDLPKIQKDITSLLRRLHRIQTDEEDDFLVTNQTEMIEMANDTIRQFKFLLGGIASISLLVGGIGIMNIMLVTVTERTREIGIRKAIGARQRSILLQFLLEALIVSGLGGLIGAAAAPAERTPSAGSPRLLP